MTEYLLGHVHKAIGEYRVVYTSIEKRFKSWEGFCYQNKQVLRTIVEHSGEFLTFFESENTNSFGATLRVYPSSDFVMVDEKRIYGNKQAPLFLIRQDHQGLVIFESISAYFLEGDKTREIRLLREPIWPDKFDYQELPKMVADFIRQNIEWESAHQTPYKPSQIVDGNNS